MAERPRLIYLHGFASSPKSTKALYFAGKFGERVRFEAPDLTECDFEHTTLSRQLAFLGKYVGQDGEPVILMGSSMGGYLAALFAARHPRRVSRVILMAPAFGLAVRWTRQLGFKEMGDWQRAGYRAVFHYGEGRESRISYELINDGIQYEEFPDVRCPALLIHGLRDESVDYRLSERFAVGRENVELMMCGSDHQLLDVLDTIWERVNDFVTA